MTVKLRVWQYSLRTILATITVSALVFGAYAQRKADERYLVSLIERYHEALDQGRFDVMEAVAREAADKFPNDEVAKCLVAKQQFVRDLARGKRPTGVLECIAPAK